MHTHIRMYIYLVRPKNCLAVCSSFPLVLLGQNGSRCFFSFLPVFKIRGKVKHRLKTIVFLPVFSKQQLAVFHQLSQNSSRSLKERFQIAS